MSFDLGIWSSSKPLSTAEAGDIYVALCPDEGEPDTSLIRPQPDAPQRLSAFLADLTQHYPELSSLPDDRIDQTIWSGDFDETDVSVVVSIRPSCMEVPDGPFEVIRSLASTHELVLYDPQDDAIYLPPSLEL